MVFKKIFGEHPHLLKSFLNAVLPLPNELQTSQEKQLRLLWLRFMREISRGTEIVSEELIAIPEIKEALHLAEEAAYSEGEF